MKLVSAFALTMMLFVSVMAQNVSPTNSSAGAFWVDYWSRPRPVLYGSEEEDFNRNMKEVMFPWNDHEEPSNPDVLDDDAKWLKEHPNVRLYIDGYASSRGELIYNLALSQRRAEWVKRALLTRGIGENRIVVAAGWGQLYPVCVELNDECWTKNRLVRFKYSPGS